MSQTDRTPGTHAAEPGHTNPALKVCTPRVDEFEEALSLARKRWDSLPRWLKASMKHRLRSK